MADRLGSHSARAALGHARAGPGVEPACNALVLHSLISAVVMLTSLPAMASSMRPAEGGAILHKSEINDGLFPKILPRGQEQDFPGNPQVSTAPVARASPETKSLNVDVWSLGWFSTGGTKHSHDASAISSFLGNPTSTLEYQDLDSSVLEFGVQVRHSTGWFFRGMYGAGGINNGRLVDDDFLSAEGAAFFGSSVSEEHLFSRTFSGISGDSNLWYLTTDVGRRVLSWQSGGGLDTFVGLQYWREHYEAFGATQIICTTPSLCDPPGAALALDRKVISNTMEWLSFRMGLQAQYQLSRLQFHANAAFIPYTRVHSEDTHHLRETLRQPSFTMQGSGIGVEGEVALSFRLIAELYFNVGYRYWWLNVLDGTLTNHPVTGGDTAVPLTEFQTFRHGVTLGAQYRF
jgi:hypothetical protein